MKVEMNTKTARFKDLAAGDVFLFKGNVFMKVIFSEKFDYPYSNASGYVRLTDGHMMLEYPDKDLKKLDGAYVVE